jgi:hypothetical protein
VPELFEPLRLPMEALGAVATTTEIALLVMLFGLGRRLPRKWRGR